MAVRKKAKGKGWHGDAKRHSMAGRKGGLATARTHGDEFYRKIGRKGGRVSPGNFKNNPNRAREEKEEKQEENHEEGNNI